MKWGKIRKKSPKGKAIQKIQDLIREILKIERGNKCELCGSPGELKPVGVFHILPVGGYQRLRFSFENILLSCWFPCHYSWHHDFEKAQKIKDRIVELRGKDYKFRLMLLQKTCPRVTPILLDKLFLGYSRYLEGLQTKKREVEIVKEKSRKNGFEPAVGEPEY